MQDNNHICIRCGYSTSHLVTFKRHLARKNICKNKVSDDSLKEEYIKYNIIDRLNQINPANSSANPANSSANPANSTNNPVKITEFICDLCENTFSRKDSLLKHQHGRCKNKNNENMIELVKLLNEQLKEQKEQMKEQMKEERQILNNQIKKQNNQIKEQSNQITELIKKAGITNIQQNIKLLSYGSTDISHLTDKDFLKCLNHSNFCIPHLIEKIHFNPKNPENHNIYISNIKNNYAMLYNGNKWILKDRDETIMNLIDDKDVILEQKLEEWIENGKEYPKIMSKFKRYIDKKDNNKVLNKIKDEIKLVLFNNREMVDKKQCL